MGTISHKKPAFTKNFRVCFSLQFNLPHFTEESWSALNCRQIQDSCIIHFVWSETLYNGHSAYSRPLCLCITANIGSCYEWEHKKTAIEGTHKVCTAVYAFLQILWSKAAPPSAHYCSAKFRNFQWIEVRCETAQCQNPNPSPFFTVFNLPSWVWCSTCLFHYWISGHSW